MASRNHSSNFGKRLALLAGLAVLAFLLNIAFGSVYIPISEVLSILMGGVGDTASAQNIILKSRLPEAVTAALAGGGLAVSGLLMQTIFRNPLAGPSVLGITSGASLGVALVVLTAGSVGGQALSTMGIAGNLALTVSAIIGAAAVLLLILAIARKIADSVTLLIVGLMLGYATSAVVNILTFYSSKEAIRSFVLWGFGSFSGVSWSEMVVFAGFVVLGLAIAAFMIKPLNALLHGEDFASSIGVSVQKARILIIAAAGILAGAITAYCGPVAFLGLAVPHVARLFLHTADHRILLPGTALTGIALALLCDLGARLPGIELALPLNVVTSLFGAPVVIWIILKRRKFTAGF